MAEIRTPEGVTIRVTSRPPEFFLRIVTPSGLEFRGEAAMRIGDYPISWRARTDR